MDHRRYGHFLRRWCDYDDLPNSGPEEASFILVDSHSSILFVDSTAQVAKIQGRPEVDAVVRHIISFVDDSEQTGVSDDRLTTMADVIAHGRRRLAAEPELVRRMIDSIEPDDLCTLIYTSGTTGTPKGVELTHQPGPIWDRRGRASTCSEAGIFICCGCRFLMLSASALSRFAWRLASPSY
ncbi:long-chain-fatty-acid-CoA ligase [Cutibacterium acnes JCM 18918]|nr:long-chain-fatty-acid-CoA ligase [Cutibacterium acnes JCM 18918]